MLNDCHTNNITYELKLIFYGSQLTTVFDVWTFKLVG